MLFEFWIFLNLILHCNNLKLVLHSMHLTSVLCWIWYMDRSITCGQLLDFIMLSFCSFLLLFFCVCLTTLLFLPQLKYYPITFLYLTILHSRSPALGDNRGIHHTISCRRLYKLSKTLHRENANYRLLHYTLKYALCLGRVCVCMCLCEWWWYRESCSP